MRIITYLFLIFLSVVIAWYLGLAAQGWIGNLLMFATIIIGANYYLKSQECLIVGVISLFLGILLPPILWTYGEMVGGDSSGTGMLGTILMYLFVPIGIGMLFIRSRKKE